MPAPIISMLIDRLTDQVQDLVVWDGEVPRQNTDGTDVVVELPADLVFKLYMPEGGIGREWTFEDPYSDEGDIHVLIWATRRSTVEDALATIETVLAKDWDQIGLGQPYFVYDLQLLNWYSGQEEGVRTRTSPLLYRGELHYHIGLHGNIATR